MDERGREQGMWDTERERQSRDSAVYSVISYSERQTPGTALGTTPLPPSSVAKNAQTFAKNR